MEINLIMKKRGEEAMDLCKAIDGERWSLHQDRGGQCTIRKGKDIHSIININHQLTIKEAFNLIAKAPSMKCNYQKLNIEEKTEDTSNKVNIPVPKKCVFCGVRPTPFTLSNTSELANPLRALRCGCISKAAGKDGVQETSYKRWVYTVDIINNNTDDADIKLINAWNARLSYVED